MTPHAPTPPPLSQGQRELSMRSWILWGLPTSSEHSNRIVSTTTAAATSVSINHWNISEHQSLEHQWTSIIGTSVSEHHSLDHQWASITGTSVNINHWNINEHQSLELIVCFALHQAVHLDKPTRQDTLCNWCDFQGKIWWSCLAKIHSVAIWSGTCFLEVSCVNFMGC